MLAHAELGGLNILPGLDLFFNWFSPYSFMLTVFFFVSGYLYNEAPSIFGYIKKRFKRLVIPYYTWNAFYVVIFFIVTSIGLLQWGPINLYTFFVQPWVNGEQFAFNLAAWFVLTLFLTQLLFVVMRSVLKRFNLSKEYLIFGVFLLLGLMSTYLSSLGCTNSFFLVLNRVLFGLPFIQLGFLYKTKLEKYDKPSIISIILLFVVQFSLLHIYGNLEYNPLYLNYRGNILQPFLSSFTGIWLCLQISMVFAKVFRPQTLPSKLLKNVGDNSWSIMINQFFGFWLLSTVFLFFGANGFNLTVYKTDIYYRYLINGDPHSLILYVIVGISFPLILSYCLIRLRRKTGGFFKRKADKPLIPNLR